MDHRLPPPKQDAASLYEADYYAWVQSQVEALHTLAKSNRTDLPLDLKNLAEEVEDMGKGELRGVFSLIEQVLIHLLKIRYAGRAEPVRHWRREVTTFRLELREAFTRSMRAKVMEGLPTRYLIARNRAIAALEAEVPDIEARIPTQCPWTLDEILAADDPDRV